MRIIEAFVNPVDAVAVSADGRVLAAATEGRISVFDWLSGQELRRVTGPRGIRQLVITTDGNWVVFVTNPGLWTLASGSSEPILIDRGFSGGVAVSPDGKTLAATRAGQRQQVKLELWDLPSWRRKTGFDFWSPFDRLAFSPNGEFLAGIDGQDTAGSPQPYSFYRDPKFRPGIDPGSFELRIAVSGGLNGRQWPRDWFRTAFLTFPRHSETVVFGWGTELQVMETRAGNMLKRVTSPGAPFADATFTGSGQHLATVDGTPVMRVWSADSWEVVRGYDWGAGGLTSITTTADGLGGVCGTTTGKLVVFDVDD